MPAEDFSICMDWSTCFSLESLELIYSAYNKRRMALGQAPGLWDPGSGTWTYEGTAHVPLTNEFHFQDSRFWSEIQDWIFTYAGKFVDPTISNWSVYDFSTYSLDKRRPWTIEEMVLDASLGGALSLTTAPNALSHIGLLARLNGFSNAFRGTTGLGFRVSTDIRRQMIGVDPLKGGEYFYDYTPGAETYWGYCLTGDYVAGNPNTLDPWLPVDLCAAFSMLYKVLVESVWDNKGELNYKYGYGNGKTRQLAEKKARLNVEYDKGQITDGSHVPADLAVSYFWPVGGNSNDDCQEMNAQGHYPGKPWMVINLNMANAFGGTI